MKLRSKGICILAGAGPGDIGLVTLRTKEADEQVTTTSVTPEFLNRRRWKQELSLTLIGPPRPTRRGIFGAHTIIDLVNDGPANNLHRHKKEGLTGSAPWRR
jgi:siroheme synthase